MHLSSHLSKQIHPQTTPSHFSTDPISAPKTGFKLRAVAASLLACGLMMGNTAYALSVQPIRVLSSLGEPFHAEIVINDVAGVSPASIHADLASDQEFYQVGLNKLGVTRHLHFATQMTSAERGVITITSDKPLTDPYIEFVVHIGFGNNSRLQKVTALVDPPLTRVQTGNLDLPVQRIELAQTTPTASAPAPAPVTPTLGTVTVTRGVITTPLPVSRKAPPPMDAPSRAAAPLAPAVPTPQAAPAPAAAPVSKPVPAPTPMPVPTQASKPVPAPSPAPAPVPTPSPAAQPAPSPTTSAANNDSAPSPLASPIAPMPLIPSPTLPPPMDSAPQAAAPVPAQTTPVDSSNATSVAQATDTPLTPSSTTPPPMDTAAPAPASAPVEPAMTEPAPVKADTDHAYTVQHHDSLWGIASRMPNTTHQPISVIMQSIKQMNKSAFIAGNSNQIRSGAVLIMPTDQPDEPGEKHADQPVHIENEDLDHNKAPTLKQPDIPVSSSKGTFTRRGRLPDAKMTLVAPTEEGSSQGGATQGHSAADDKKLNQLNLQITASRQKNLTLGQEVGQLEAQIKANDQKIALQNARLAELMQRLKNRKEAATKPVKRTATS